MEAMTASFHTRIASAEAVMLHYDPERIHGYCTTCPQHGRFWSCPPYERPPLVGLPAWDHAVLVFEKVGVEPGSTKERMLERFFEARKDFRSFLLGAEARHPGTTALVAGHCLACEECSRATGEPCRRPSALRYSLEALGFHVTGLAESAGQKILWPRDGMPEYLLTVGAILCAGRDRAEMIEQALTDHHEERCLG